MPSKEGSSQEITCKSESVLEFSYHPISRIDRLTYGHYLSSNCLLALRCSLLSKCLCIWLCILGQLTCQLGTMPSINDGNQSLTHSYRGFSHGCRICRDASGAFFDWPQNKFLNLININNARGGKKCTAGGARLQVAESLRQLWRKTTERLPSSRKYFENEKWIP